MRYFHIFLLNLQIVFTERGRSFIWFLNAALPSFIFLLFWMGAIGTRGGHISGWNISSITAYYFLLMVATSLLIMHVEEDVSEVDIYEGRLTQFLIKPFPYFWLKFFGEIPYRILQGGYGVLLCIVFFIFFGNFFSFSHDPMVIFLSIGIVMLAFILSFAYKMVLGLCAFWLTDARGFYQLAEAILLIFGGFILPITLLPHTIEQISGILPFAYFIYYPVVSLQGKLSLQELLSVIFFQFLWIGILCLVYRFMWSHGRKKFSGIGQ